MDCTKSVTISEGVQPIAKRQPLQPLPATPLNKRPTPIQIDTPPPIQIDTPPPSSCVRSKIAAASMPKDGEALTPPITPVTFRAGRSATIDKIASSITQKVVKKTEAAVASDSETRYDPVSQMTTDSPSTNPSEPPCLETIAPTAYTGTYTLTAVYGRGLWSTVHRAIETSPPGYPNVQPLTPPTSPSQNPSTPFQTISSPQATRILAIKTPSYPLARRTLHHEAFILTYLSQPPISQYIIPFHGFEARTSSLVLAAIPLTLETHSRTCLKRARENFTTRTMFDPVVGSKAWLSLARGLVRGLAWLHERGVVHGDIKPANVLLERISASVRADEVGDENEDGDGEEVFRPVYCDFSSSHIPSPSPLQMPNLTPHPTNDALTPPFTAPELLLTSTPLSTPSSDIFSLGVTLLAAATGEHPYASARGEMQRLAMAKEGRPMEFARAGEQGTRVMRGRMVEQGVGGALGRKVEGRWGVGEWEGVLAGLEL